MKHLIIFAVIFLAAISPLALASIDPPLPGELGLETFCLEHDMITRLPITMYTPNRAVNELGFTLNFDQTKCEYVNCVEGDLIPNSGWDTFTCTLTAPGQLDVYAYSETGSITQGLSGDLFLLDLCCIWEQAMPGDETPITFSNLTHDFADFIATNDVLQVGDG